VPCREQLVELQRHRDEVWAAGGAIVAVAPGPEDELRALERSLGLGFALVSDPDLEIARRYGVRQRTEGGDARRPRLPVPSVFVADAAGRVAYAHVATHPGDRPALREVLSALERSR
jgi:peroxiredoxin